MTGNGNKSNATLFEQLTKTLQLTTNDFFNQINRNPKLALNPNLPKGSKHPNPPPNSKESKTSSGKNLKELTTNELEQLKAKLPEFYSALNGCIDPDVQQLLNAIHQGRNPKFSEYECVSDDIESFTAAVTVCSTNAAQSRMGLCTSATLPGYDGASVWLGLMKLFMEINTTPEDHIFHNGPASLERDDFALEYITDRRLLHLAQFSLPRFGWEHIVRDTKLMLPQEDAFTLTELLRFAGHSKGQYHDLLKKIDNYQPANKTQGKGIRLFNQNELRRWIKTYTNIEYKEKYFKKTYEDTVNLNALCAEKANSSKDRTAPATFAEGYVKAWAKSTGFPAGVTMYRYTSQDPAHRCLFESSLPELYRALLDPNNTKNKSEPFNQSLLRSLQCACQELINQDKKDLLPAITAIIESDLNSCIIEQDSANLTVQRIYHDRWLVKHSLVSRMAVGSLPELVSNMEKTARLSSLQPKNQIFELGKPNKIGLTLPKYHEEYPVCSLKDWTKIYSINEQSVSYQGSLLATAIELTFDLPLRQLSNQGVFDPGHWNSWNAANPNFELGDFRVIRNTVSHRVTARLLLAQSELNENCDYKTQIFRFIQYFFTSAYMNIPNSRLPRIVINSCTELAKTLNCLPSQFRSLIDNNLGSELSASEVRLTLNRLYWLNKTSCFSILPQYHTLEAAILVMQWVIEQIVKGNKIDLDARFAELCLYEFPAWSLQALVDTIDLSVNTSNDPVSAIKRKIGKVGYLSLWQLIDRLDENGNIVFYPHYLPKIHDDQKGIPILKTTLHSINIKEWTQAIKEIKFNSQDTSGLNRQIQKRFQGTQTEQLSSSINRPSFHQTKGSTPTEFYLKYMNAAMVIDSVHYGFALIPCGNQPEHKFWIAESTDPQYPRWLGLTTTPDHITAHEFRLQPQGHNHNGQYNCHSRKLPPTEAKEDGLRYFITLDLNMTERQLVQAIEGALKPFTSGKKKCYLPDRCYYLYSGNNAQWSVVIAIGLPKDSFTFNKARQEINNAIKTQKTSNSEKIKWLDELSNPEQVIADLTTLLRFSPIKAKLQNSELPQAIEAWFRLAPYKFSNSLLMQIALDKSMGFPDFIHSGTLTISEFFSQNKIQTIPTMGAVSTPIHLSQRCHQKLKATWHKTKGAAPDPKPSPTAVVEFLQEAVSQDAATGQKLCRMFSTAKGSLSLENKAPQQYTWLNAEVLQLGNRYWHRDKLWTTINEATEVVVNPDGTDPIKGLEGHDIAYQNIQQYGSFGLEDCGTAAILYTMDATLKSDRKDTPNVYLVEGYPGENTALVLTKPRRSQKSLEPVTTQFKKVEHYFKKKEVSSLYDRQTNRNGTHTNLRNQYSRPVNPRKKRSRGNQPVTESDQLVERTDSNTNQLAGKQDHNKHDSSLKAQSISTKTKPSKEPKKEQFTLQQCIDNAKSSFRSQLVVPKDTLPAKFIPILNVAARLDQFMNINTQLKEDLAEHSKIIPKLIKRMLLQRFFDICQKQGELLLDQNGKDKCFEFLRNVVSHCGITTSIEWKNFKTQPLTQSVKKAYRNKGGLVDSLVVSTTKYSNLSIADRKRFIEGSKPSKKDTQSVLALLNKPDVLIAAFKWEQPGMSKSLEGRFGWMLPFALDSMIGLLHDTDIKVLNPACKSLSLPLLDKGKLRCLRNKLFHKYNQWPIIGKEKNFDLTSLVTNEDMDPSKLKNFFAALEFHYSPKGSE